MNALGDAIGRFVPLVRRRSNFSKQEALAVIPVRNSLVEWERAEDEVVLSIPTRNDRLGKLVKKIIGKVPDTRKIGLDDLGGTVWELCDGKRDVNAIVGSISDRYKLGRRESEASVTMFLQTLAKKNLIGLMAAGGKKSAKRKR